MGRWFSSGGLLLALALAGCAHGVSRYDRGPHPYLIANDGCNCDRFIAIDSVTRVVCEFTGTYSVDTGVTTKILMTIRNDGRDTLDLSLSSIRIASRNLAYRYNDRFLPMSIQAVVPGERQTVTLIGESPASEGRDPWYSIAGEELTLTVRGMRIRGVPVATQTIRFVPTNPKLSS